MYDHILVKSTSQLYIYIYIYVTGFAKRDHFCINIHNLICEKNAVKTYQKTLLHTYRMVMYI